METSKLTPYSVYLPSDLHKKLKALAKDRKASEMIRNAIQMLIDGHHEFNSGYNQALKDAITMVTSNEDAMTISISSRTIGMSIIDDIKTLEKSK
jgi:metal-responsive CopG/Arc/MetJ family transcriptional regulator